jgi:hypothetical protein
VPERSPAGDGALPAASAIEWSFNPWRDRPGRAFAALAFALGLALLVGTLGEPPLVRIGLGLAAVGAMAPMLLPARCRVDDDGVMRRDSLGTARRRWSELRRGVAAPAGFLVSPYPRPHWLDLYRGLLLPMPPRRRAALLADLVPHLRGHGL